MAGYFDHERLEVYQMARRFNREIRVIVADLPQGTAESKANLTRAAMSVTRNIAEGSGKWRVRDKTRFYHIARGSATECAACLDELVDFGVLTEEQVGSAKGTLGRVVAMLIVMIRSLESREGDSMI